MSPNRIAAAAACLGLGLCLSAAPPAVAGPEKRCSDLASNCLCSEPMDVNDGAAVGASWNDPSDSPDASECTGKYYSIWLSANAGNDQINPRSNPSLAYGGTKPPQHVLELTGSYTNLYGITRAPAGSRRLCARWYERFGAEYQCPASAPPCATDDGKLFDMSGANGESSAHQVVIRKPVSGCGTPGNCGTFGIDQDTLDDTAYGFSSLVTPDTCRMDGSGNGGWCRFEICVAGDADLTGGGNRYYDAKIKSLDSGNEVSLATNRLRYSAGVSQHIFNSWNGMGGEQARREVSYYMEAAWPSDAGQWIGAAAEIEGSGGSTPTPTPTPEPTPEPEPEPTPPPAPTPGVVFSDDFEGDLGSILARWGNGTSDPSRISLVSDVPPSSPGSKSLQLATNGGGFSYLFKQLASNYERLYYRYYVKYEGEDYHHSGAMLGGYEPPTSYPQGDAGLKGVRANGDKLLNLSFEAVDPNARRLDFYNNWIDMQGPAFQGQYYGRHLLQDLNLGVPHQWTCVELMVGLNTPASASNGELAVWIDGAPVVHFRPGAPNGFWDAVGNWRMDAGSPAFGGFRWRDTSSLGLNWVKLQSYNAVPRIWFDDVVVSTERIGCNGEPAPPPPAPEPIGTPGKPMLVLP
jgi:hypothetical protein